MFNFETERISLNCIHKIVGNISLTCDRITFNRLKMTK